MTIISMFLKMFRVVYSELFSRAVHFKSIPMRKVKQTKQTCLECVLYFLKLFLLGGEGGVGGGRRVLRADLATSIL